MSRKNQPKRSPVVGRSEAHRFAGLWNHPWILAPLLALVVLVVYWPATRNAFVNYDDPDYFTANRQVQKGLTGESLVWALKTGHASNWHPVTWISHMADWQLFGAKPAVVHLVSVLLHALNAALLFLVLLYLTGHMWRSWLVAALFALHPLHVESVAWVAERKDLLSTCFLLLVLAAFARYTRQQGLARSAAYVLALVFFAFGLMSKPMLVTVPFVLLLLDYWPLGRITPSGDPSRFSGLLMEKLPFMVLTILSSIVTFLVQQRGGAVVATVGLADRLANAMVSYCRYILKTFWPVELAVLYPHPIKWPVLAWLAAAATLILITGMVLKMRKTRPYLLVGWFWFLGTLVPVIGIVQVGIQAMADRYTYIPLTGLFIALVWGISEIVSKRGWSPLLLPALSTVVLAGCAGLTVHQLGYWRDSGTLFRRALEVTTNNFMAYNNLGVHLGRQGNPAEEMESYRKSLEINPRFVEALNNMGSALGMQGRFAEALPYYEAALRERPNSAEIHYNLGSALSEVGRREEAVVHFRAAIESRPDYPEAFARLGLLYARTGQLDAALEYLKRAAQLEPNATILANLGNALALKGNWEEANRAYMASLKMDSENSDTHYNAANALVKADKWTEAIAHYRECLRIRPSFPEARYHLGLALLHQGDRQEAVENFQEALRLKPGYTEAARQLQGLTGRTR